MEENEVLLEDFNVVLEKDSDGKYIPSIYQDEDGDWIAIGEGDILNDWIIYTKLALKQRDKVNRNQFKMGNWYPYQWGFGIRAILKVMNFKSETLDVEWSRQTGKTFLLEHIVSFLTVFASRYKHDLVGEQWTTITASYDEKSAKKNFRGIKANIEKCIDIYNQIYGNSVHKLVYNRYKVAGESKKIPFTSTHFQIDVLQGDKSQHWSEAYALSTNTNQDGYASCLNYADEGILVDAKDYLRSIDPFTTANSACTIVTGIASTDSSCLQYAVHNNPEVYKSIYDWEDIYRIKKQFDEEQAEKFKQSVLAKIQLNGGHNSTEVRTNYYMDWEITDGKFTTREQLRKNNVFATDIEEPNINADYIVAGLDLATTNDYMVLTISEVYKIHDKYKQYNKYKNGYSEVYEYNVKEIFTFNEDKKRMDVEIEASKLAKLLNKYKVDMIAVDNTASEAHTQAVYRQLQKNNCDTLLVPYNFSGAKNKVKMMGHLELSMFSNKVKIPKEKYKNKHFSFTKLYEELLYLRKYKNGRSSNVKYEAPKGENKTDDHVMSLALSTYAIEEILNLQSKRQLIEVGTEAYKPKLHKYRGNIKKEKKISRYYI